MTRKTTRRAVLLAAAGSALVLPAVQSGTAHASLPLPPRRPGHAFVTNPREPDAVYGSDAARNAHAEPLNAAVGCAVHRGGRS
ncbi:hypothetical protein [Streptomyces sp. NPDC058667]|uniref:hypothetical protein n=1 Tax=Streptomyces sp. NPDC058667 TaxID=3346588 RepID=UPI00365B40BF